MNPLHALLAGGTAVLLVTACSDRPVLAPEGSAQPATPLFSWSTNMLAVPEDFATIQAAVDAAGPGDVVRVGPGTYCENVVVTTSDVRLEGEDGPVLDGTAGGCAVSGLGIGIHVLGSAAAPLSGVEIRGFVVQNFEQGIVLQHAQHALVRENEVGHSTAQVIPVGAANGIFLISVTSSELSENFTHDNGHDGIQLAGSSGNLIRENRSQDNGGQTVSATNPAGVGCDVNVVAGSHNNEVRENELLANDWGVFISANSNGNLVVENVAHNHDGAGVAVLLGDANVISENDATGNGLANVAPSLGFDLFDSPTLPAGAPPVNNTWVDNLGTANF